jgi:hypothetical protein
VPDPDRKDTQEEDAGRKETGRPPQQKEAGPAGDKELRPGENKGG